MWQDVTKQQTTERAYAKRMHNQGTLDGFLQSPNSQSLSPQAFMPRPAKAPNKSKRADRPKRTIKRLYTTGSDEEEQGDQAV